MAATNMSSMSQSTSHQDLLGGLLSGQGQTNVGDAERVGSVLAGSALAVYGATRGSLSGWLTALAGGALVWRGVSGWCQLYGALGINSAERSPQASLSSGEGMRVEESITVNRPAQEVYRFWRELSNLPRVFKHLREVRETGGGQSHWTAKGPLGDVSWDAEIITDRPGEIIAWRSLEAADVATAGSVRFERGAHDSETAVHVVLRYSPPAGRLGANIAQWMGESPDTQIESDLQTFKEMLESQTGSTNLSQGSHSIPEAFDH